MNRFVKTYMANVRAFRRGDVSNRASRQRQFDDGFPDLILQMAVPAGLPTGLGEVFGLSIAKSFLKRYEWYLGPHLIWMSPLANVFIFLVPGVVLFFVSRQWPRAVSVRLAVFVYAFLGLTGLLSLVPVLHALAMLVLAAGLAWKASFLVAKHARLSNCLLRWPAGWIEVLSTVRRQGNRQKISPTGDTLPIISRRQFVLNAAVAVGGLAVGTEGW